MISLPKPQNKNRLIAYIQIGLFDLKNIVRDNVIIMTIALLLF